jgi:long-chain acyl-CoA synthetase
MQRGQRIQGSFKERGTVIPMNNKAFTLSLMLREQTRKHPKRVGIIFNDQKITYSELEGRVGKLANALSDMMLGRGCKIAILLPNGPDFVVCYFAVNRAGSVAVPVNNMLKQDELAFILEDAGVSAIITSSAFYDTCKALRSRVSSPINIITVDKYFNDTECLKRIYEKYSSQFTELENRGEDIACILYTSGTTGRPKGAMLSNQNIISNATASAEAIKATKSDNAICFLPMFHSFALTACIMLPISVGGKVTIVDAPNPFSKVIKAVFKNRVTVFVGIPSVYNILKDADFPGFLPKWFFRLLNPVRVCISGAAALPVNTLKIFEDRFRVPLLEGYGLTEASPVVSINPIDGIRKPGSIGLPLRNVKVAIADEEGQMLNREEVGELLVKGPNVMKGYFGLPEETDNSFTKGWLRTGDMAKIDEGGYIYIVDRKKDMVNVRGMNVYPKEIEDLLCKHPRISEAAVIGIRDKRRGEMPKAFIKLKGELDLTPGDIIRFCRKRIAPFKVPKRIEFRDDLPRNATGKVLKNVLREEESSANNGKP